MTDHYDQDKILGYVEGELGDEQRDAFEAVLADDHELRQLVSQMKLDRQALRGLGSSRAPVGLIDQVIQSNERSELLGDPAAPEPLPMTVPVSRWTFRRAAAYGAIAAVLILSFGLVFQTLIPPGSLTQSTEYAQNTTDTPVPDVGSGIALLDEDSAYDAVGNLSLGREQAKESSVPPVSRSVAGKLDKGIAEAESLGMVAETDGMSDYHKAEELRAARIVDADTVAAPAETVAREKTNAAGAFADASTQAGDNIVDEVEAGIKDTPDATLAMAEATNESDANRFKKQVLADAFVGYKLDSENTPTQLVVNSASPSQARRDIRDWALANSVRFVEETADESTRGYGINEKLAGVAGARAGGGGGSSTAGHVSGLASGRQSDQDNQPLGDTPADTRDRALLGQTQPVAGATLENTSDTSYFVLIDQDQVPSLLTYLNRTEGQRAQLIGQSPESLTREADAVAVYAESTDGLVEYRRDQSAELAAVDRHQGIDDESKAEEKDAAPKATANRLVDTESGWFNGSDNAPTVRGLTAAPGNNTARRHEKNNVPAEQDEKSEQPGEAVDTDTSDDRSIKRDEQTKDKLGRKPTYFDWSRLLEPRKPAMTSTPSVTELADETVGEKTPETKLRLLVIIQQTADEVELKQDEPSNNRDGSQ